MATEELGSKQAHHTTYCAHFRELGAPVFTYWVFWNEWYLLHLTVRCFVTTLLLCHVSILATAHTISTCKCEYSDWPKLLDIVYF